LVDNLVQGSHHHDETLCELLLAARNTKLGDAAKRALRHAARKRVMELMSENDQTAVSTVYYKVTSILIFPFCQASEVSDSTVKGKDKPLPKEPGVAEVSVFGLGLVPTH
jgi:hypothetical protein